MIESADTDPVPESEGELYGPPLPDPWWRSLLVSTGYLLLIIGVPGLLMLPAFSWLILGMAGLIWGGVMAGMILVIALGMLAAAHLIPWPK